MTVWIWALLFARWFITAESTALGGTLWVSLLTVVTAAVWAWLQSRRDDPQLHRDLWDRAVWALVISHVLSAVLVVATTGQKRLALNMVWEWTSVGLQFLLLRQTLLAFERRRAFLLTAAALWSVIAAYGVWQHFVAFPHNAATYATQRAEYDELMTKAQANPADALRYQSRIETLRRDWVSQGVPVEGHALGLFERRLRDSREPLGFFALANSLSGMVASVLVLLLVATDWTRAWQQRRYWSLSWLALAVVTCAVCLLLTKSRTAYAATLAALCAGVAVALCRLRFHRNEPDQRQVVADSIATQVSNIEPSIARSTILRIWILRGLVGIVLLSLLIGTVISLGGLDVQVVSEAPKSLRYRLEYWTATARIIQTHPLFGVGPGNFRSHYLRHKLPSASEEIADPHSFVLDVLANSGLVGGAALLFLLSLCGVSAWRLMRPTSCRTDALSSSPSLSIERAKERPDASNNIGASIKNPQSPAVAALLALALVVAYQFVVEAQWNLELVLVGLGAAVVAKVFQATWHPRPGVLGLAALVGIITLLVHLLGAGGIASPAIANWLLALMAVLSLEVPIQTGNFPSAEVARTTRFYSPKTWQCVAVSYAGLAIAIAQFGWLPVMQSDAWQLQGDLALQTPGRLEEARECYLQARRADALSTRSLVSLAEVEFLAAETHRDEARFQSALQFAEQAVTEDTVGGQVRFMIGHWYRQRWVRTRSEEDAQQAVHWIEAATREYPTNPFWHAELALAYGAAEQTAQAQTTARKTLAYQTINQKAGHLDRLLSEPLLQQLESLAK